MDEHRPASDEPREVEAEPYDPAREEPRATRDMPPPGRAPAAAGPVRSSQGLAWAMACHLGALLDFSFQPLLVGFVPTLLIWLLKRNSDPEVDYHGKESLNFQLNLLFWWMIATPLAFCLIGIPMWILLSVAKTVLAVIAAIRTAEGERFRYPGIYRIVQ